MTARFGMLLTLCGLLVTCVAAAQDGPCRGQEPTGWDVSLVSADEPGTAMIISGTVYDSESGKPIPNVNVYAYQTDAEGYYSENKGMNNRNPRLCVVLRSNDDGRFRIHTIRPADYATGGVRAHVHFVTWAEGVPRRTHLLQFAREVRALPESGLPDDGERASARVQPTYRDAEGQLHVRRDLRVDS